MDAGMWVVIGFIGLTIVLLYIGAVEAQRRYHRMHPPDDWDGMREDREHEDD